MPAGVAVMNPYRSALVRRLVHAFSAKFLGDDAARTLVLGINPGRFGAGITGITFTDPVALADFCDIPNHLPRRRELSSVFIYELISRLGGPAPFYRRFFLTAVSPLGFTRGGTNLNYYDEPKLVRALQPFIVRSVEQQIALGGRRDHAIVLGLGQNQRFVRELNARYGFFEHIHALEHPRWIMQYRRPHLERYLRKYADVFSAAAT